MLCRRHRGGDVLHVKATRNRNHDDAQATVIGKCRVPIDGTHFEADVVVSMDIELASDKPSGKFVPH